MLLKNKRQRSYIGKHYFHSKGLHQYKIDKPVVLYNRQITLESSRQISFNTICFRQGFVKTSYSHKQHIPLIRKYSVLLYLFLLLKYATFIIMTKKRILLLNTKRLIVYFPFTATPPSDAFKKNNHAFPKEQLKLLKA